MRTLIGLALVAFGVYNGMREYANLASQPDLQLPVLIGLFIPSVLFIGLGLYLVMSTGKR